MKTIAITSGKGGVGKTNISVNLAIQLSLNGHRTIVFDADLGLANVDVILGIRAEHTLQDALSGEKTLRQIIQEGPGGVRFIAGGSGIEALANLQGPRLEQFLGELAELEGNTDVLIFDTGAGIDNNVLTFLQAADEVLLVATPDPASVTDAYAISKALWARRPSAQVKVILNMVNDEAHALAVFGKLRSITEQFLGKSLSFGGYVRFDHKAMGWIRKRRPFVINEPRMAASIDIQTIAARLVGGEEPARKSVGFAETFRSLFGLKKSA